MAIAMAMAHPPGATEQKQPHVRESLGPDPANSSAAALSSDQPESSDHRSTIACCNACKMDFAEFYNGWQQITGSYYLPSLAGSYRIAGLHTKSKPKLAAADSALHGCTIQPLACNHCDDTLAIVCIKAPENKRTYAEREFFKLPKIKLRSELNGNPVDAIIEGDHQPVSPKRRHAIEATNMEHSGDVTVTTVQKPSLPSMSVLGHKPQDDSRRNDLPSVRTVPSQPLEPKPVMSERDANHPPQARLPNQAAVPVTATHSAHPQVNGAAAAAINHSSQLAVKLDAIDRIQTQVSLNRATLESCTRDITRLESSFTQLHAEFRRTVEAVRMELLASRQQPTASGPSAQAERIDDQTLEVFSTTLSHAVSKANEVDVLSVQFEVIKRRLRRLEEGTTTPTAMVPGYPPHPRDVSMHRPPVAPHGPQVPLQPRIPSTEPRLVPSQPATYTPEPAPQPRPLDQEQSAAAGWVSVNTGLKRGPPSGGDGQGDAASTPVGSPKRAKLVPLEPRYAYEAQAAAATPVQYERMDTDESTASQGHHAAPGDSYPDATNPSTFIAYTQDGGSDGSWRPASQRAVSGPAMTGTSPRGRGRGRGRGGRPRKSMPLEPHIVGTPEWEKEGWTGSQIEADGFYQGGIAMRGSGGAPGAAMSPIHAMDPYSHTKRSRTKPIRNAEGVLIRKDGRPDMRSQSSAANLRKVHAKKEEERLSLGGTASALAGEPSSIAESPASTVSHDVEPSNTQERAEHIMKQMFPKGVEQERARLYTVQQYFPSDQSQTASAASTPVQRTVSESEAVGSVEPEKARDDSPQQHDEPMVDHPAENAAAVEPTPAPPASTQSPTLQLAV